MHYLCMEFLVGRSLRNNAYNLGMLDALTAALKDMWASRWQTSSRRKLIPVWATAAVLAVWLPATWTAWRPTAYAAPATPSATEHGIFKQKIVEGQQVRAAGFLAVYRRGLADSGNG